jgi:serine/threonine protein kinase
MKSYGIAHCDIKPENILINVTPTKILIKLCDFGICCFSTPGNIIKRDFCGTPGFFAPEVLLEDKYWYEYLLHRTTC